MTAASLALPSCILAALVLATAPHAAAACTSSTTTMDATPSEIRAYFKSQGKVVLTLLGYSGAGYEDDAALIDHAGRLLDQHDPRTTIVNSGATADGVGRVYELARQRGFTTTGIVSTQARESGASISPCVDQVFYVTDATWGGFIEGGDRLSPTSQAMVDVSDRLVAIGGGEIARDELIAAERAGKNVTFIPADMNHRTAIEKAAKKGQPAPDDFRGAVDAVFGTRAPGRG
jgi:hypothetical protein